MRLTEKKESVIQKEIITYLKTAGYLAERLPLSGLVLGSGQKVPNNMSGFPDILAVCKKRRGVIMGIEVKRPGGKLSEKQIAWKQRLEAAGGVFIVATSVEELIKEIAKQDEQ